MGRGLALAGLAFLALGAGIGCGDDDDGPTGPGGGSNVAQITLAPADTTLTGVNDFFQLIASAVDGGGNPVSPNLEWRSSDSTVVTVDNVGLVVARGEGVAAVTARTDTVFGTAQITVDLSASAVDSVAVAPDSLMFAGVAQSQALTAQAFTAAGDSVTTTFGWASRDVAVATVDAAGLVTSVSAGTTFVVATANGISDSAWVGVAAVAPGTVRTWTNPSGGSWQQASNWSGGMVPAAGDTARIDAAGTYTLAINGTVTVARIELGGAGATPRVETNGNLFRPGEGFVAAGAELALEALPEPRRGLGGVDLDGELQIDGTLTWIGGPIEGDGSVVVGPTGVIEAGGTPVLGLEVDLTNQGTIRLNSDVTLSLSASLANENGALFDFTSDSIVLPTPAAEITNAGTIRKSGGTFDSQIGVGTGRWISTGTVDVQSGTLQTFNADFSGSVQVGAGAILDFSSDNVLRDDVAFSGDGEVELAGDLTIGTMPGTTQSIARMTFRTGTVQGPGTLEITESLTWRGGTFAGPGAVSIAAAATARTTGSGFKTIAGGAFSNAGTFEQASSQVLTLGDGSVVTNEVGGLWLVEIGGDVSAGVGTPAAFENDGTMRFMDPTRTVEMEVDFTNRGNLDLRAGRFEPLAGFDHTAGATISGGGTSGALNGNLRLDLATATSITFAGKVAPDSAGTFARLDILGPVTLQATAEIEIDAHGQAPYFVERVNFLSPVALAGTLTVVRTFTPNSNDEFSPVAWATGSSGTFGTENAAGFQVSYDPLTLRLTWP